MKRTLCLLGGLVLLLHGPGPLFTTHAALTDGDGTLFNFDLRTPAQYIRDRFALPPEVVLFAARTGQSQPVYVNSIQFRNYTMTDAEVEELGGPDPAGIPGAAAPPAIRVTLSGAQLILSWEDDAGDYQLESASDLGIPAWETVEGVAESTVTVPIESERRFYRLRSTEQNPKLDGS